MNEKEFCFWLRGYMELTYSQSLDQEQLAIIWRNLNSVFNDNKPKPNMPQPVITENLWHEP